MTENQRPEFLRPSGLLQTFGLELIESVITNHAAVFKSHPEQAEILRARVMPLLISAFKGKPNFATTVRLVRVLYTILRRHISILAEECGEALDVLTQLVDHDTHLWKRALCMEVFRGVFAEYALLRRIYSIYDAKQGRKDIVKTLTATFVRLSTEKPAVIGLGNHSTLPVAVQDTSHNSSDQAILEATGMTGVVGASSGSETLTTGISTQWSSVRVPCIDQLDKTEPPAIPESYIYSLVLSCISSLSDGLAKFILPLTVPSESRKKKTSKQNSIQSIESAQEKSTQSAGSVERSVSFKKNPQPLNPLDLDDHPLQSEVKTCSSLIEECWPAILATCSTFLYSALDTDYYHGLVRAFQRFAHVAGLLALSTPRDAFLTTLGKSAVPPNVLTASLNAGQARPTSPNVSETPTSPGGNSKAMLSSENLTPASPALDKGRQMSADASLSLNTRNLLCLRALLNLGIALGPTLGGAWKIILDTLQQADFVLYATGKAGMRPSRQDAGDNDASSLMANFGTETRAVETAAARLMESTIDFPNDAFVEVIQATCDLLARQTPSKPNLSAQHADEATLRPTAHAHKRTVSFSLQSVGRSPQQDKFALAKLGDIAIINIERLLMYPANESGWTLLTVELASALETASMGPSVRTRAAEIMVKLALEAANLSVSMPPDTRAGIQVQVLSMLQVALGPLSTNLRSASIADQATDIDIHRVLLDGLKAIMDDCGESLISGWEIAFEIIASIFVADDVNEEDNQTALSTRSPKLIRSAFSSLQLICSDFLTSLPRSCFLLLVDTVYKFCSQDDDLNIALTTVTFFWVLSDFLSRKSGSLDITADLMKGSGIADLEALAADEKATGSDAALWMLLLLRLTTIASDDRLELRNSAIQTLLRIFDAYGERLSPEAWSISVKFVIFKLLASLEGELQALQDDSTDEGETAEWNGTAVVVLDGTANLLADYLDVLTTHASFSHLWRELLSHLATLLDFQTLDISTAAFKALGHILSRYGEDDATKQPTVESAWKLWARGIPTSTDKEADNQACLSAYLSAYKEVYRLCQAEIDLERIERMLTLLHETVQSATVGPYASDTEQPTLLQSQVLQSLEMIRSDVEGSPSAIIKQLSRFVSLAFGEKDLAHPKRTFVAFSKASMQTVERTILAHASKKDIYTSSAVADALISLREPIALKYSFAIPMRSTSPWRTATESSLVILNATLPQVETIDLPAETTERIWTLVADVADGILNANCKDARPGVDVDDDEQYDLSAFTRLRKLVVPNLGAQASSAQKAFTNSLFQISIVHDLAPSDRSALADGVQEALPLLKRPRPGRTAAVYQARRADMAYLAFEELFTLSCAKPDEASRVEISRVVAPSLVVRCALTLRAYVADQPLRGKMPQPLSQRKELTWMLRHIVGLKADAGFKGLGGSEAEAKKYLLPLYPLLVQALQVTADERVASLLREAMEAVGAELGL